MKPAVLDRYPLRWLWRKLLSRHTNGAEQDATALRHSETSPLAGWQTSARRRRAILALLVLAQTAAASWSLARTFPSPALSNLEIVIIVNFAVLFSWISFSFWSNVAGFWSLWTNSRRFAVIEIAHSPAERLHSRTAVLMPICNEDVARCFAGVTAIYESLAGTGEIEKFDFYILSDTGDKVRQKQEEQEWEKMCRMLSGFGRIFYRHRRVNIKRKSGNIADFLRRWSRNYDYMIVLDADSLMSGEMIVRLARCMEQSPQVGMIQTAPTIVNRESMFARVQQFASRVYGPLFTASLHFWQLGESYYWGHNAIIRVDAFVEHCGLVRLPGDPPLGGEILSHDFVEAALMGRAGFEIWLAHDWSGSYEESPPNILDELKRDRRWCQGNLQHLRLLFGDGIRAGHRAIMAMGVMAYASALFWGMFLVFSSVEVIIQSSATPVYFSPRPSLFPIWPIWHPELTIALLTTTGVLLILPKLLSYALILKRRETAAFGGTWRLAVGIVIEIVFSTLMAPLRLWFHCKFVLLTLLGRQIKWNAQARNSETGWTEAVDQHGLATLFAVSWMAAAVHWNAALTWWLLPVSLPLIIAVPLSVYSSRLAVGWAMQRWQLLRIPEEFAPPPVVERLQQLCAAQAHDKSIVGRVPSSSWQFFARESSTELS
ncbi:MAG TPA: glucans biosynthesis glucosyltransferase MdoH [Candidatus Binatia bacterium]